MSHLAAGSLIDWKKILVLENDWLRVLICPEIGGRILSLVYKPAQEEMLWHNPKLSLEKSDYGAPYNPNFWGGIDEIIPGDIPETINGLECPDHGELWTLALESNQNGITHGSSSLHPSSPKTLKLWGMLPMWRLRYEKSILLQPDKPWIEMDYRIVNQSNQRRVFLWKLHAALQIDSGDRILCPARQIVTADPFWSKHKFPQPAPWPGIQADITAGKDRIDIIPPRDDSNEYWFLIDLAKDEFGLLRSRLGLLFLLRFDLNVFPYACYYASYGGLDGHYTAVLEPATAMPVSVNEAARLGQCPALEPGEVLETRISIYAGPAREMEITNPPGTST